MIHDERVNTLDDGKTRMVSHLNQNGRGQLRTLL